MLVAFFVVFIPYNWLREPSENLRQEDELLTLAYDRGELAVQPFSEENQLGVGCVRCHGPELRGGVIQAGDAFAYPPDLTNSVRGPFGTPPPSDLLPGRHLPGDSRRAGARCRRGASAIRAR